MKLRTLLSHTDFLPSFNKFCQKLLKTIHASLGWYVLPEDTNNVTLLRPIIIGCLILFENQTTIAEAKEFCVDTFDEIPADMRKCVYQGALSNADTEVLKKFLNIYRETTSQEEQRRIYSSFVVLENPKVIQEALDFAMSSDVRSADSAGVVGSIAFSGKGRDIAWKYFKDNVTTFQERFGEGTYIVPRLVESLTQNFASLDKIEEVEAFFKTNEFSGVERTVQQSIEKIRLNQAWLARDSKELEEFLKNYQ